MLQELSIRNFAIIDDLCVSFCEGLTVLTGETGAGKSIIINAVHLLLGGRASPDLIRSGADTAELEALFQVPDNSEAAREMKAYDLDPAEGLLVRRVLSRHDRHRIYVNGRQSTVQMLARLTGSLAGIAGQHAHQTLLREETHLSVLDRFGGLMALRGEVGDSYRRLRPLIAALASLQARQTNQGAEQELLSFQYQEIADASVVPGEDQALEQERLRLKNSARLYQIVHDAMETLYHAPGASYEQMGAAQKALAEGARLDQRLAATEQRLAQLVFQLEDVVQMLRDYLGGDPQEEGRLEQVEARLDVLNRLKRKYGGSLVAVMAHFDFITQELAAGDAVGEDIRKTRERLDAERDRMVRLAKALSDKRAGAAATLASRIETELSSLNMPQAGFKVMLSPQEGKADTPSWLTLDGMRLSESGLDQACFMIAPNTGEAFKPLAAIASGGELSRVVLALKAILAGGDQVDSIVFDEVDAGIGGGVAEVVGKKLATLSQRHQIICITHLPQIAKFGDLHYKISKQISDGRTRTTIAPVQDEDRVQELARMLGGVTITRATLDHARELLG